jgi:hypothetical protein
MPGTDIVLIVIVAAVNCRLAAGGMPPFPRHVGGVS